MGDRPPENDYDVQRWPLLGPGEAPMRSEWSGSEHADEATAGTTAVNVAGQLADRARGQGWSDRPAYFVADTTYTHGWVHSMAARVASVLKGHGATTGTVILVVLPDGIAWVVTFLAAARLGSIAVTVNPDLPANDHAFFLRDCAPDLVVCETSLSDRFRSVRSVTAEELMQSSTLAPEEPAVPLDPQSPLYVQYTSGTTGTPKGVVHRHSDLAAYHGAAGNGMLQLSTADVSLSSSKLYFPYGFGNSFVYPLHSGSAAVLRREWLVMEGLAELVTRRRVTVFYAVPSVYSSLVAHADPHDFTTVRVGVSAGEPLTVPLGRRATGMLGAPLLNMLGSTEVGGAFCANTIGSNELGTIGHPLPGYELSLRDSAGAPVAGADGEAEGHLWVRGPTLMVRYLNRAQETDQVLVDGWLFTSDVARRRRDGRYVHLGRSDDMEIVAGLNIAPVEVEGVLAEHPAVREVAVATVPDGRGARQLHAFIVPARPTPLTAELKADLLRQAQCVLAPHKVPREVHFVPHLPRTPTGKLRRSVVRTGSW